MKLKSILSLALLILTTVAFSQTSNLRKGKTSYGKFSDVKSMGSPQLGVTDLNSAHQALLKAIEHDKTKDLAETWVFYGLTTSDLALLNETEQGKTYQKSAVEAYEKAKSLDTENEHADNLLVLAYNLAQLEMNGAVKSWDAESYMDAYHGFSRAESFIPGDTTLLYYAGAAAIQGQDYQAALGKYLQLVDVAEYSNHKQIILDVPRIYMMEGDTVSAVKHATLAMDKYPEDTEVVTQFIEYNLLTGNEKEVIETIKQLSAKEPNNKVIHYYLGLAYSSMADDIQAEEAYKKALAIDPNFADANINLGGLILNRGIDQWNLINGQRDITQADYDAGLAKAHEIFDSAYPYLQLAVDIDATNIIALENLQKYYQIKDDQEKSNELQAKIDALNQQ